MASIVSKRALSGATRAIARFTTSSNAIIQQRTHVVKATTTHYTRSFTATTHSRLPGLMPHSEDPEPPKSVDAAKKWTAVTLEDDDYHQRADEFMNKINERAEALAEERDDVEVDFAVCGVATSTVPC